MTLEPDDSVAGMLRDYIEKLRSPDARTRESAMEAIPEIAERAPGRLPLDLLQKAGERLFEMTSTESDPRGIESAWYALLGVAYGDPAVELPWDAVCERAESLPDPLLAYAASILVVPALPRFRDFFERLAAHPNEAVRQEATCGLQALAATQGKH